MDRKLSADLVKQIEEDEGIQDVIEDYVPGSDEEKKLVRKIDCFLLPTIFLMYLFSYMDRTKYVLSSCIFATWENPNFNTPAASAMPKSLEWPRTWTSTRTSILSSWSCSSSVTFFAKSLPSKYLGQNILKSIT